MVRSDQVVVPTTVESEAFLKDQEIKGRMRERRTAGKGIYVCVPNQYR